MTTVGMDTVAGRAAGQSLSGGADEIAALAARLDGLLHGFDWKGPDADQVRDSWSQQHRPQLDTAAGHLTSLSTLITKEADAQDRTSDTGSATAVAGGGAGAGALGLAGGGGVVGWIGRHLGAFLAGANRTGAGISDLVGKIGDVLTGERAWSVTAIAASAVTTLGSAAGSIANAVTGQDERWFAEGPGHAGTPVASPLTAGEAGAFNPVVARPTDLSGLMQGVTDGYTVGEGPGSVGDVRITRIDNGTGPAAYVVAIPGTESWSPVGGSVARDLTANLALVGESSPTAAAQTVERAMAAAGIPPGSPVMLVGHSQGGIIAAQLASDPRFVATYGVTNVMTYGAPIDHIDLAPGVHGLQVQHGNDWVPRLDAGGVRVGLDPFPERVPTVTLDSPGGFFDPAANHSHVAYIQSVRDGLAGGGENARILNDYQSTLTPFLATPTGTVTAVDVPVSRGE